MNERLKNLHEISGRLGQEKEARTRQQDQEDFLALAKKMKLKTLFKAASRVR